LPVERRNVVAVVVFADCVVVVVGDSVALAVKVKIGVVLALVGFVSGVLFLAGFAKGSDKLLQALDVGWLILPLAALGGGGRASSRFRGCFGSLLACGFLLSRSYHI